MSKLGVRSAWSSVAVAIALGLTGQPATAGQNGPNIGGILGIILNSALANQAGQEWQSRPSADFNCLEAHNTSVDQLAASGIGPNDPRVQRMFAQCARDAANQAPAPIAAATPTGLYRPNFVVDGLAVGAAVHPESPTYQAYKCHSSEEFSGFTWCAIKHPLRGKFGAYDSWVTILHSDANTAVFILQDIVPAFFAPGDANREIQRLSQRFGQAARIYNGDPRPDVPHSVIATWGDVTLTPLDQPTLDALSRGETINAGLVIDFLADSRKSAREGLPVFHIGGGSGYIWAAKFDDSGKGLLQITAVDASLLPGGAIEHAPESAPPAPTQVRSLASAPKATDGYVSGAFTYRLTEEVFNPSASILPQIKSLYGQQTTLADWDELKSLIDKDSELTKFVTDAKIPLQTSDLNSENILIQKSGTEYYQGMHFLLVRHDGSVPDQFAVVDSINDHTLDLGRWNHFGKALIKLTNASESATSRETASQDPAQAEKERAARAEKAVAEAQKEPPKASETLPADTEQASRSGKIDANPSPQPAEQSPHHYSSAAELLESGRFRTIEERNAAIAEFNSQSAERAAEAAKEQEDRKRAEEMKQENEEAAVKDAVPTKGPEFLNDHRSEWKFSEAKDPMTDEAIYSVNSIQRNEDGVVAGVTGTCLKDGTIQFLATITDDDGKPTIDVIARNLDGKPINGVATVRYRLNDNVQIGTLPDSQFNNRFVSLTINGPAAINKRKEQLSGDPRASQAVALLQAFAFLGAAQGVIGVDFDLVWGAMIEFETNKGNLVVSIPVFHPAIQQLYEKCFTHS
jgi:hypothetical protein